MKTWTKIQVFLEEAPLDWAVYAEIFEQYGVAGTQQHDSPPSIEGYLAKRDATEIKLQLIKQSFLQKNAKEVKFEEVAEEDWAESWKQFFHPKQIGKRFFICPSWENISISSDQYLIVLDPGQAFGTGEHPTTKMCLELLEILDVQGKNIADIGCGSGILSIGAAFLGAKSVVSVDVETSSVDASAENASRNKVKIDVYEGKGFEPIDPKQTFDIVLSNIISPVILDLIPSVKARLNVGGHWLISGVIEGNWPRVHAALTDAGFKDLTHKKEGEWIAAIFYH